MKTKISLFIATGAKVATHKENGSTQVNNKEAIYTKSLDKWTELKKLNGNSYQYQIHRNSCSGHGNITELTIKNGIVIARTCKAYKIIPKIGTKKIKFSYSENQQEIGKHKWGALPKTIDQLYSSYIKEYLTADTTKNNKTISLSNFVTKNCTHNSYEGVTITSFKWIK